MDTRQQSSDQRKQPLRAYHYPVIVLAMAWMVLGLWFMGVAIALISIGTWLMRTFTPAKPAITFERRKTD